MHDPGSGARPERILLYLATSEGALKGKAIRFSDESEIRFESAEELTRWLSRATAETPTPETESHE
jgi:hypothetical protein